jgi:hypothetical protein
MKERACSYVAVLLSDSVMLLAEVDDLAFGGLSSWGCGEEKKAVRKTVYARCPNDSTGGQRIRLRD